MFNVQWSSHLHPLNVQVNMVAKKLQNGYHALSVHLTLMFPFIWFSVHARCNNFVGRPRKWDDPGSNIHVAILYSVSTVHIELHAQENILQLKSEVRLDFISMSNIFFHEYMLTSLYK
jgi:hypothetical protein